MVKRSKLNLYSFSGALYDIQSPLWVGDPKKYFIGLNNCVRMEILNKGRVGLKEKNT